MVEKVISVVMLYSYGDRDCLSGSGSSSLKMTRGACGVPYYEYSIIYTLKPYSNY